MIIKYYIISIIFNGEIYLRTQINIYNINNSNIVLKFIDICIGDIVITMLSNMLLSLLLYVYYNTIFVHIINSYY